MIKKKVEAKITYTITVQIDLKDDTHARFEVPFGETIPQFLERNPVYVTHKTVVRTGGSHVHGVLMSYVEDKISDVRILDVSSTLHHFLVRPIDAPEESEPYIARIGDCFNLREHTTTATKTASVPALKNAPRCYYKYNPTTGRRPCTIDMERNNKGAFQKTGLPSCPFVNDCFTRSDCLYITGNDVSESEGAELVARNLR